MWDLGTKTFESGLRKNNMEELGPKNSNISTSEALNKFFHAMSKEKDSEKQRVVVDLTPDAPDTTIQNRMIQTMLDSVRGPKIKN